MRCSFPLFYTYHYHKFIVIIVVIIIIITTITITTHKGWTWRPPDRCGTKALARKPGEERSGLVVVSQETWGKMGIKLGGMTLSKIWAIILCFIEHGPRVGHIALELEGDRTFGKYTWTKIWGQPVVDRETQEYLSSTIYGDDGHSDKSLDKHGGLAAKLYQFMASL